MNTYFSTQSPFLMSLMHLLCFLPKEIGARGKFSVQRTFITKFLLNIKIYTALNNYYFYVNRGIPDSILGFNLL